MEDESSNGHRQYPEDSSSKDEVPVEHKRASGQGRRVPWSQRTTRRTTHAALDRLLSCLLVEIDGVASSAGKITTYIGACNDISALVMTSTCLFKGS